jgi:hypothetical protein
VLSFQKPFTLKLTMMAVDQAVFYRLAHDELDVMLLKLL